MPETKSSPYAFYAFYQLYRHFTHAPNVSLEHVNDKLYQGQGLKPEFARCPLFVTWKILHKPNEYRLRGCIGTFAECEVSDGLERYALVSALQDSRFRPIQESELGRLQCSCNLLSHFETIYSRGAPTPGDIWAWQVGTHGVELKFRHPRTGARLSATFLPEVMAEEQWDQRETYENLVYKAGCGDYVSEIMAKFEEYVDHVIVYRGTKSQIGYAEFKRLLGSI